MENQNTVQLIALAVIVMLVIQALCKKMNNMESFVQTCPKAPKGCASPRPKIYYTPHEEHLNFPVKNTMQCKIEHTESNVDDYIWGSLLGRHRACPGQVPPRKVANQALEDHLHVRDVTNTCSHDAEDAVDRVNQLYLTENCQKANMYGGVRIRDLYNQLTRGPTLYNRVCSRAPKFDNYVESDYYDTNGPQEFYMKRKHWKYGNEHPLNGGQLDCGLYGRDPYATPYFPIEKHSK